MQERLSNQLWTGFKLERDTISRFENKEKEEVLRKKLNEIGELFIEYENLLNS
jgi:hypothetical protein